MSKTIMAVGAHTGDAQLTCGMLLAKHAMAGDKIVIVDLTAGERGTPAGWTTPEFREYNVKCAADFAKGLGGDSIVFDDYADGELERTKEIELKLARIMREYQVSGVLYHWPKSLHKDHIVASQITTNACFYAALTSFPLDGLTPAPIRSTMFAENWEDAEDYKPYCYFDVSEAFPLWKENMKKLWLAEHSRDFKYLRYYEALAITRGAMIKADYATTFAIPEHEKRVKRDLL